MSKGFRFSLKSIPIRITLYMIGVLITTAILILIITNRHFNEQTIRYHEDILRRKEKSVLTSIEYLLDDHPYVNTDNVYGILDEKILEITDIISLDILVYDLKGNLKSTTEPKNPRYTALPNAILDSLAKNEIYIENFHDEEADRSYYTSYSYIKDINAQQNLVIIGLPYYSNDAFLQEDKSTLMGSYGVAFIFILLLGAIMIYVVSNKTFNTLSSFADRIKETQVISNNIPIQYNRDDEIRVLVDAYNEMLIKLKEQSEMLAEVERQETWREFARQVAHEIKNPLTPMKLMIQNYMRKFKSEDNDLTDRTMRTSEILMQQIETIESIADAFSDFAKMPSRKDESIDLVDIVNNTLELFPIEYISFTFSKPVMKMMFDKQYLNRIITNLVKNAFQSVPSSREANIAVDLSIKNKSLFITVEDNGIGISEEAKRDIFKPRFTTKSSGSGIGLSMVKKIVEDYDGAIRFDSVENLGTKFIIQLPYNEENQTV